MPRKVVKPEPAKTEVAPVALSPDPRVEVLGEATRVDDADAANDLVIQRVLLPRKNVKGRALTFREGFRVFVRPDESHNEPDCSWDEHETEDEAALRQLFATYGKGSGTRIEVRLNVTEIGRQEFFLDVRHPKPEQDDDTKCPSIFIDRKDELGDLVADIYYSIGGEDTPDDFMTRGALEDLTEELKEESKELDSIAALLDEFDMPGDKGKLYSLSERLRSIFRTAKGLSS